METVEAAAALVVLADAEKKTKKKIDLERVTTQNMQTVRILVQSIFPVSYSPKFYQECLENELTGVLMRRGEAIAIVSVKPEQFDLFGAVLYIRSLGVHLCYRENGIGSLLMDFVEEKCRSLNLATALLHVQTSNQRAIDFYEKRGFKKECLVTKYYHRCDPPDAFVMTKCFWRSVTPITPFCQ
uniref:N-terminal methionine N(alpha)-acetyltransferase NatE n=1 Tax=Caenorhabditis japonica TaxID=281687 RepID=A0A8R1HQL1_CAEJA